MPARLRGLYNLPSAAHRLQLTPATTSADTCPAGTCRTSMLPPHDWRRSAAAWRLRARPPRLQAADPAALPGNDTLGRGRDWQRAWPCVGASLRGGGAEAAGPDLTRGGRRDKNGKCGKCDKDHDTDECPYYKKAREDHPDATRRKPLEMGGSGGNYTMTNGRVVRSRRARAALPPLLTRQRCLRLRRCGSLATAAACTIRWHMALGRAAPPRGYDGS